MENNSIENMFCMTLGSDNVRLHEPMKKHTTFRIGGPADYYLCPHSTEELQKILQICRENKLEFFILGNGSNLLVSDKGYRGVVIQLWKNFSDIETEDNTITVKAGTLLSKVAAEALEESLTGMEFASGIPGTMGGAVMMNAGAYGGEMKDIIREVTVLTREGELLTLSKEEMNFGYRTSVVKEKGYVVISAVLQLRKGDREEIRKVMDELKERRVTKQPLDMPSAGSTFKRPEGYFAGKLIMDAGLRGFSVGGAQISEKHCGFVVNKGEGNRCGCIGTYRRGSKKGTGKIRSCIRA